MWRRSVWLTLPDRSQTHWGRWMSIKWQISASPAPEFILSSQVTTGTQTPHRTCFKPTHSRCFICTTSFSVYSHPGVWVCRRLNYFLTVASTWGQSPAVKIQHSSRVGFFFLSEVVGFKVQLSLLSETRGSTSPLNRNANHLIFSTSFSFYKSFFSSSSPSCYFIFPWHVLLTAVTCHIQSRQHGPPWSSYEWRSCHLLPALGEHDHRRDHRHPHQCDGTPYPRGRWHQLHPDGGAELSELWCGRYEPTAVIVLWAFVFQYD